MQSKNYVPGVSGWKLHADTGFLEVNGVMRMGGLLGADFKEPEPAPFIIVGDVVYIRQAVVDDGPTTIETIQAAAKQGAMEGFTQAKDALDVTSAYSIKVSAIQDGQYAAAGIGLGINHLKLAEPKVHFPEAFRDLIREELHKALKPGGLLHRR